VRLGLIGAGAIARRHLDVLQHHDDAAVTVVCDVDRARAQELALSVGARAVTDWAELVGAPDVDAVVVCTPPTAHAGPERGLPVYLEKPLARSAQDGDRIVEVWRRSEAVCAVGYQWRSLEIVGRAREALAGAPPGMLVSRGFGPTEPGRADLTGAAGSWFADRRASGGILFELASHDIDLQVSLAGPAARVSATAGRGLLALRGRDDLDLDDSIAVMIEYASGAIGIIAVAWNPAANPPTYTLDVQAAAASVHLELDPVFRLTGTAHGSSIDLREAADPRRSSIERFLAAARSGDASTVPCSPADALDTLLAALAAERAVATGEGVTV
jgi:myo-inositol 2-dehydrogenase / D-chiro-inositol 1-dehydrogenase